jgi:2-methylcitrate dehydratase PrpD
VVALSDGTHLSEDVSAVLGTMNNPMTRDQVVAKSRDLMAPLIGESASQALIEKILDLQNMRDIRELRAWLQRT